MRSYTKIIVLLFVLMMISFFLVPVNKIFLYVGGVFTAGVFVMFFNYDKKQNKIEQQINDIKGDFINRNYPEVNFDPDDSISLEEFSSLGIMNLSTRKSYDFKSGGLVYGNAQGIPFRASHIYITHTRHDSSDNRYEEVDYNGITAVFNISDFYDNQIVISSVAGGGKPVEMSAMANKVLNFAMKINGFKESLPSKDIENKFGKPIRIYSDNLEYAENFLTDTRLLQLNEIPFSNIAIKGNQVALDLPKNVAKILMYGEVTKLKKNSFIDYNADIDPEIICEETRIVLDLILSFPEAIDIR